MQKVHGCMLGINRHLCGARLKTKDRINRQTTKKLYIYLQIYSQLLVREEVDKTLLKRRDLPSSS